MSKDENKMPMSTAGLTRYFDESPEALKLRPEHVAGLIVGLVFLEIFLYLYL